MPEPYIQQPGSSRLRLVCRLFLGAVFLYAGATKIISPAGFAAAVHNYHILPPSLVNLFAVILPWLEITAGACLVAGVWLPGAVMWVNVMLLVFLLALVYNQIRGLNVNCGCFSTSQNPAEKISTIWYIMRDMLFLVPALYLATTVFKTKR